MACRNTTKCETCIKYVEAGREGKEEEKKALLTFMTGAQKCTVLTPTSLSHAFLNQLADCSPAVVLCHRLPCWRNCWRKNCCDWLLKKGEEPALPWRKTGRAARKMLLVGAMACERERSVRVSGWACVYILACFLRAIRNWKSQVPFPREEATHCRCISKSGWWTMNKESWLVSALCRD